MQGGILVDSLISLSGISLIGWGSSLMLNLPCTGYIPGRLKIFLPFATPHRHQTNQNQTGADQMDKPRFSGIILATLGIKESPIPSFLLLSPKPLGPSSWVRTDDRIPWRYGSRNRRVRAHPSTVRLYISC